MPILQPTLRIQQLLHISCMKSTHEIELPLQQPLVLCSHVRGEGNVHGIQVRQRNPHVIAFPIRLVLVQNARYILHPPSQLKRPRPHRISSEFFTKMGHCLRGHHIRIGRRKEAQKRRIGFFEIKDDGVRSQCDHSCPFRFFVQRIQNPPTARGER